MPLYQYKCKECSLIRDEIQSMDDRLNPILKQCINSNNELENKECIFEYKLSNVSNPQFKGNGFYETDYK
jgi:predicted nucleic acid-binding Zn ribbon protein